MKIAIDSSVLVALLDSRDLWRTQSLALHKTLPDAGITPMYFDCVTAEAISAAVRRLYEKGRGAEVTTLLDNLRKLKAIIFAFVCHSRTANGHLLNSLLTHITMRDANFEPIKQLNSHKILFSSVYWTLYDDGFFIYDRLGHHPFGAHIVAAHPWPRVY